MSIRVAFYKGTRPGIAGIYNCLVRWWCQGPYSHCELVFPDGMAASASFADGGVRIKRIDFDAARWDFVDLPTADEPAARAWLAATERAKYDVMGNVRFILPPLVDSKRRYFCSEWVASALGIPDAWRFDPNTLHAALLGAGALREAA